MLAHITIGIDKPFEPKNFASGKLYRVFLDVPGNSLGVPWQVPVIVIKGREEGPTLGITSAVHGNELNGILSIFKVIESIKAKELNGTIICCPIFNVPGFLFQKRYFPDGQDLNRIMPGLEEGTKPSEIYNYYLTSKLVSQFDYHLDLHTASVGKANSLYIRADLEEPESKRLAYLQNPHIIVQKTDEEGTLRGWASESGIPSITIEIGNPDIFQPGLTDDVLDGVINTLTDLDMISGKVKNYMKDTHICTTSYWLYAPRGGLLEVMPKLTEVVEKEQPIANLYDMFGQLVTVMNSDNNGIVIGKATTPYCEVGSRVLHLGILN